MSPRKSKSSVLSLKVSTDIIAQNICSESINEVHFSKTSSEINEMEFFETSEKVIHFIIYTNKKSYDY